VAITKGTKATQGEAIQEINNKKISAPGRSTKANKVDAV
jgi:hypothetical protein